jgi:hypothetical protein
MTVEQIMALPAAQVYTTLLLDFEESQYQKQLMEIHRRNSRTADRQK